MAADFLNGPSELMENNSFLPVNANTSWLSNACGLFLLTKTNQTVCLLTNSKGGCLVAGTSSLY
jgi:hypothetical protein